MSDVDPDQAAREFAQRLSSRKGSTGIPRPPSIEVNDTTIDVTPINFELDAPTTAQAFPGGQGGGGGPPPSPCPPPAVPNFSVRFQCSSPAVDYTMSCSASYMPRCSLSECHACDPVWARSFSAAWCSYWYCGPGPCTPIDDCGPNGDTGDWCEQVGDCVIDGIHEHGPSLIADALMDVWLRWGTVNGEGPGWHVLVAASADFPYCHTGWVNFFLGATLNGVAVLTCSGHTFTWTFAS